jgi:hypothetical protein
MKRGVKHVIAFLLLFVLAGKTYSQLSVFLFHHDNTDHYSSHYIPEVPATSVADDSVFTESDPVIKEFLHHASAAVLNAFFRQYQPVAIHPDYDFSPHVKKFILFHSLKVDPC